MPLEPIDSLGGFTASPGLPLQREEGGDTTLATIGKVAAPLAIGAGLLLAPEFTIPALVAGGAAASYADPEAAGAAFRTENTVGSVLSSDEMGVDDRRIDPQFDPWAEIQGTPYEPYYEQFGRAANRGHFDAIKSDIDRENKDRDIIAKSGIVGMGATMAAGVLDLPSLLPGGVVLRSAKGGVSMLKTAAGTAAAGTGAAVASETVLQQSQQLRTAGESATVIAGSAVLSGLLGAGLGRRMARQEFDGLAARVERDFTVPGPGEPDPFMPGSFKPSVEAAPGASEKARSVADAIRETAEEILPRQVRVQVVDSLGPVGDDGFFSIRMTDEQRFREGRELLLPYSERWGNPRFDPADKQRALDRIAEIGGLDPKTAAWTDLVAARNDLREISSQLLYYKRDTTPEQIDTLIDEVWHYGHEKAFPAEASDMRPSIFSATGLAPEVVAIADAMRPVLDRLYGSKRAGLDHLMLVGRGDEPAKRRKTGPEPERIGEARGGFYFKAGRELENVPDALFRQGGQAVIDHLSQAGVKKAEIKHFGLDALAGKKSVTREEFAQTISERVFEFRRKTSWFNPESNRMDYETGGTRAFSGPRIPGRGVYFERLMAFPKKLKGGEDFAPGHFQSPHWEEELPGTWASWRGSVREVPGWGKMVVGEEGQTDLMQGATTRNADGSLRRPRVKPEEFLKQKAGVQRSTPETPIDDSYVRTMARDLLLQAAAKKADAIAISTSDTTARIQNTAKAAHFYDAQMKPALERELRRVTGDGTLTLEKITLPKPMGGKKEKPYTVWATKLAPETVKKISAEGQPLFARRTTPEGDIGEGHFDPEKLLITIAADALDPAKTLRHESIHALKTMGLFTGKDWGTLEAAAKREGWLETNNIKALYEGVYKDRITDELLLEEAIAEQFSLWRQGAIQVKGAIAKLFERIQQFLERTGNALRGRGFQTADDVFAAVRSGEVGSRAPGGKLEAGIPVTAAGLGRATSAGASAVERADDTLKSALGLEKAFYWQDPMLRLQNSLSPASKRHVQELAETPLAYNKNELGEPTAPGGSEMGAPGAVETRIKFWQGALADAVQAVDQGFMKYRTGHAKRFTGETVLLNMRDTVYGTDALTYPQFKQEIAKALRRGDEHQIPEIAGAARIWRQKVLDPLKDEAIEHEMLPEGVTPETAPSYLNRLYNKDKIIAERDQVKTIVADWLERQESINRGVRVKVAPLLDRRKILEERVAKYERQIERRSAATAKIAARRQEASGLNRFAYSRAQKLSEPIDQVRGEIDTIANSIRTQLDRIEELSAAIREEKLNLPEIATVERQSIKIGHALADLKRDAALIDMVEAAESIEKPLAELYEASSGIMGALREQAKFARMTPQAQALVALEKDRAKLGRKIAPFRKKLRDLRTLQQKMEKARNPGARGGAVFESKIRSRVNTLADQEAGKKAAIEDMQMKLDRAQDELNVVTSKLEAEITAYQGKTAGDAKGAIKQRDTAEAARTPEQRAKKARLGSADKAVVTTARKIAAQLDKEPGEVTALADEIIDRILGTPDGRLPYDAHKNSATAHGASVDARGPLAARQFMIPDAAIERYLENDIEVLGRAYVRTMSADVEMTKRFGSVDMVDQIKEIAEDYARLSAQAKTPEARRKLHKQRDNDIRDLAAIRDRLRGTYALPKNPDGLLVRSGRVINSLNYMRMLGGMTISAIPDTARTVMVHGLMRTAGDGLLPLLRNWSGARLAMTEVKLAGTALDMVLDSRAMQIADVMDDFGRHSKFERAIQAGARNFGVISLMAPWNAAMKQFSGLVTMTRMLRATERIAAGKGRPKEVAMLASGGISEANARKIAAQFAKHGKKEGGVWHANTAAWEERSAIEAFRAALVRDVDRIIVTPGQERPLWMSTETGRLIGQFKSFSISAMQRVLISGLQQRDMATLNGAIMMVALGGLASVLRAKIGGQPAPDLSDGQKQAQFLVEAIDRSGLTGWMMEANSMTEKLTRGAVGLSAVTGKPVSRYASRNISSALMGPTAGTIQDFTRVVGAAASGEWNQSDSRVMRRLIPYNNIFYFRQMFDEAEAGINGFFGVPKPAGAKR